MTRRSLRQRLRGQRQLGARPTARARRVDEGYVTTEHGCSGRTAEVDLGTLEPGTYTFKAFEVSAADGDEINVDTKTFTVN